MAIHNSKYLVMLAFAVSIILAFSTPPSIFTHAGFMSRELRAALGLVAIPLLFMCFPKLTFFDACIFLCIFLLFSIEFAWRKSELSNILSYYAVVVFYILLFRALYKSNLFREYFLRLWVYVAYFISASAITLFIFHQFTSLNVDPLGFESLLNIGKINFEYSFLGVTVDKDFGVFTVARVYSYFIEPQYASLYFIINMFLSRELNKTRNYRGLLILSLLAGILTFSITFYMAVVIFYFLQNVKIEFKFFAFICLLVATAYIYSEDINVSDYLMRTSYSDRMNRMSNSFDILGNASFSDFLFGHGVGYTNNSNRGLSSGVFRLFVERGFIGLFFVLTILAIYLNKNYILFLMLLFFLFAMPWYANYIFWMGVLMLWAGGVDTRLRLLEMEHKSC